MQMTRLPPSPPLSPLTQTFRFYRDPFTLISECRRDLGDLFSLRLLGMGTWVFATTPEHIKEMFKAPPDVLTSGEINAALLGFMLGKDATFSLDGEAHLKRRKLMHPFFNGRAVLEKVDLIRDVTVAELGRFSENEKFPFLPWAMRTSLVVVMTLLFSGSKSEEIEEMTRAFAHYAEGGLRSPLLMMPALQLNLGRFSPWGRILEERRMVFATFDRAIAERLARPEAFGDVAAALCRWRNDQGEPLSPESIRDEILTDLFAGHETTAKGLAWALECALTRPEILNRLREEIDGVLAGQPITADHLKSLPYCQAFLEETQRIRPLAPFAGIRLVKQPFPLGEYLIPPGTTLVQGLSALGERPEIFEDPTVFRPEHFLGRPPKPFTWNPFGGGRRMCLGKGLAEVELVVFLTTLLSRFDLYLAQPKVDRIRSGFFFAPSEGLLIEARSRDPKTS